MGMSFIIYKYELFETNCFYDKLSFKLNLIVLEIRERITTKYLYNIYHKKRVLTVVISTYLFANLTVDKYGTTSLASHRLFPRGNILFVYGCLLICQLYAIFLLCR